MKEYICLGAGIFNYDIVCRKDGKEIETLIEEVGGTCGNVMCILSHFGWKAFPVARLDETVYGLGIKEGLRSYGCDTSFVTNSADGGTTLLNVVHSTRNDGGHKVSVRASGPQGGRFPNYRFIKIERAKEILGTLEFVPDIFFFDSPNAGHRVLAEGVRAKGALVYFEPGSLGEPGVGKCIAMSDIVKFSHETVPDVGFTDGCSDKLFIQTMGADGVCFKLRGSGWVHLPAVRNTNVVDWEGAGDWTTAAFINSLMKQGTLDFNSLTTEIVCAALEEAQRIASDSISYMGSKGMICGRTAK